MNVSVILQLIFTGATITLQCCELGSFPIISSYTFELVTTSPTVCGTHLPVERERITVSQARAIEKKCQQNNRQLHHVATVTSITL